MTSVPPVFVLVRAEPELEPLLSPQAEILAYLRERVARRRASVVRFGHDVEDVIWEDDRKRWRIETSRGVFTADVFVASVGPFSDPSIPKLPGLDTFQGKVLHSARWDHASI